MKKAIITFSASLLVTLVLGLASFFSPTAPAWAAPAQIFGGDSKKDKTRLLTGRVLDGGDNPLPNAVVYLTNTRTRAVKTYIVGADGGYRFPALQPTLDYEVYAQFDKSKSGTKALSQFDDRSQVYITLKINTKAESK
jgi:hypothetical protein